MTHAIKLDLPRSADLFPTLRALVERGVADAPVHVLRDGKPSVELRSLHRAALLTVGEEPACRFIPWTPHPNATVGPRVAALLAARAAAKEARR